MQQRRTNNNNRRRGMKDVRTIHTLDLTEKLNIKIPDLKDGDVRLLIFGGVEEVGRNMSALEYKDTIIIIDCGFAFENRQLPGVNFVLPNIEYLKDKKDKIKALFVTHGHLDHIGGIPYLIEDIGNPTIYSRKLTNALIQRRQEEFPKLPKLKFVEVEKDTKIKIDDELTASFCAVTHTIPDSMGVIIETPYGDVVFTGDLKLDHIDGIPTDEEVKNFEEFKDRNVICCLSDSTNATNPGFSRSEIKVRENIDEIIKTTKGRLIIGTFASQLDRIFAMIESAEKYGKKVIIEGRSMKTNVKVAMDLGLMKLKPQTMIPIEKIEEYPDDKIVALVTGALGEILAVIPRAVRKEHRYLKFKNTDTMVLSSSVIPGTEVAVQEMKHQISKTGIKLITFQVSEVHSSGHANRDELKWIFSKIKPKNLIPIHGYHYMLSANAEIIKELGLKDENVVVPNNGSIIELRNKGKEIVHLKENAPKHLILVDGNKKGPIRETVINERKILGQDGMMVFIVSINTSLRKLRRRPDLISRGLIYLKDSQDLLYELRNLIRDVTEKEMKKSRMINIDDLKKILQNEVSAYITQKLEKKPVVIPVIFIN